MNREAGKPLKRVLVNSSSCCLLPVGPFHWQGHHWSYDSSIHILSVKDSGCSYTSTLYYTYPLHTINTGGKECWEIQFIKPWYQITKPPQTQRKATKLSLREAMSGNQGQHHLPFTTVTVVLDMLGRWEVPGRRKLLVPRGGHFHLEVSFLFARAKGNFEASWETRKTTTTLPAIEIPVEMKPTGRKKTPTHPKV